MQKITIPIPKGCSVKIDRNNIVIEDIVTYECGIVNIYDPENPVSIYVDYPKIKVRKDDINKLGVIGWTIPTEEQAKIIRKYECTIDDVSGKWRPNKFWINPNDDSSYFDANDNIVRGFAHDVETDVLFVKKLEIVKENKLE